MQQIINVSGYKFITLEGLAELRNKLLRKCLSLELRGTILLSEEGINVFLAGFRERIDNFTAFLRADQRFADLSFKESISQGKPFNRMLVRIKKEIIAFGVEGINPALRPSPYLKPSVLKQWLEEGRDVVLLDTRNEYEIKLGTFKNAINPRIQTFRDFPKTLEDLRKQIRNRPVVTFCTGGIRAEKAAPYLECHGFKNVYQIEGGILKYFEECGGAHWEGDCFVFDHRVALSPNLEPSSAKMCFSCRMPLTATEMEDPSYVPNVSCVYCVGKKKASPKKRHTA